MPLGRVLAIIGGMVAVILFSACAEAEVLVSRYVVHLEGVRVGEAVLKTTLGKKDYKVTVSADVGPLLANTTIKGEAIGQRNGSKVQPARFQFVTSDGKASSVNFAGEDQKPNPRLRDVFDPLSALVFTSLNPGSPDVDPCSGLIPIIMGRARFDVVLSPKQGGDTQATSDVTDCNAFSTVSTPDANGPIGAQNAKWQIGFSKVPRPHLWLVEYLVVPTSSGTMVIRREETNVTAS